MNLKFDMSTAPIDQLLDELPATSITTHVLTALDYVVPGQWVNLIGFENSVRTISGETDPARLKAIEAQTKKLYNDPQTGYQRAMWIYQTVDTADMVLAAAALSNKVGEQINFLSFLNTLTPKPEITQSLDLSLKITAELIAFGLLNGLPRDANGIMQFFTALQSYAGANVMRLTALIALDGIIPLGPDFMARMTENLEKTPPEQMEQNGIFQQIQGFIPGEDTTSKLGFVREVLAGVGLWMSSFQATHNLSMETLQANLQKVLNFTNQTNDYLAAFLDASTNYFQHTGTQSVAQVLIKKATELTPPASSFKQAPAPAKPANVNREKTAVAAAPVPTKHGRGQVSYDEESGKYRLSRRRGDSASWLQSYLDNMGITYDIGGDEESPYFVVGYGRAAVLLSLGQDEVLGDYIDIEAILASDVPALDKKGARYLLELSHDCVFGGYYYRPEIGHIGYYYRLLAYIMDESLLAMAIKAAGDTAETESRELATMTGGNSLLGQMAGYPDLDQFIGKGKSSKKVWQALDDVLENQFKYDKKAEAYYSKAGTTTVYVHLYESDVFPITIVESYAAVANEIDNLPLEAAVILLEENGSVPLGTFCYQKDENYIYFSHIIPGDAVDEDVLALMMGMVGQFADKWDEKISKLTGGWRDADY
jgi:hypothetical protein